MIDNWRADMPFTGLANACKRVTRNRYQNSACPLFTVRQTSIERLTSNFLVLTSSQTNAIWGRNRHAWGAVEWILQEPLAPRAVTGYEGTATA